jgi:hypothetical protein
MGLGDLPLFVDDVGDAPGVLVLRAVAGAVGEADLSVAVGEEREGEIELGREALVLRARVEADSDDLRVLLLVFVLEVPEPGTLDRSAGCIGLRIEPEDDFLPAQIAQAERLAVMVDGVEVRRLIPYLEHACTSEDESERVTRDACQ